MLLKLGFSGSIASGKSARSNHLATMLAPNKFTRVRMLNADHIGHQTYLPGTDTYKDLIDAFGKGILDKDKCLCTANPAFTGPFGAPAHTLQGVQYTPLDSRSTIENGSYTVGICSGHRKDLAGTSGGRAPSIPEPNKTTVPLPLIDRRALGDIVFKDPAAMSTLNGIVWPAIRRTIEKEIRDFAGKVKLKDEASQIGGRVTSGASSDSRFVDANIIICEAALLSEAGIDTLFDEVWLVGCDPEEAVRRVMNRDGLPEDVARRRVNAQKSLRERQNILTEKGFVLDSAFTEDTNATILPGYAPKDATRILRTFDTTRHSDVAAGLGEIEMAFNGMVKRWVK